jgi:hypothetical protein
MRGDIVSLMVKKILGIILLGGGFVYGALNRFAGAITLWPDLQDFWAKNMIGQPIIPWVLVFFGAAITAWAYFPAWRSFIMKVSKMSEDEKKHLNQSINIGSMSGGTVSPTYINHFNTVVAPGRAELSDAGVAQLADALRGKKVTVDLIGDPKSWAIGIRLIERLSAHGITTAMPSRIGQQFPQPSDPYSVKISKDGTMAHLVVSPSTLP